MSNTKEGVKPLYKVGDRVEVYNTDFHVSTKAGVIQSIRIDYWLGSTYGVGEGYIPVYTVYIYEDNKTVEVISDDIES